MTGFHLLAQNNNSLLLYTVEMDSLYVNTVDYDCVLVFDAYLCKDCILKNVKQKKKILLIPLDNDLTYETRIQTKLKLKRDYPISNCYFLNSIEKKSAIVQNYPKNQIIKINPTMTGGNNRIIRII
jgi:hypothetical protein